MPLFGPPKSEHHPVTFFAHLSKSPPFSPSLNRLTICFILPYSIIFHVTCIKNILEKFLSIFFRRIFVAPEDVDKLLRRLNAKENRLLSRHYSRMVSALYGGSVCSCSNPDNDKSFSFFPSTNNGGDILCVALFFQILPSLRCITPFSQF